VLRFLARFSYWETQPAVTCRGCTAVGRQQSALTRAAQTCTTATAATAFALLGGQSSRLARTAARPRDAGRQVFTVRLAELVLVALSSRRALGPAAPTDGFLVWRCSPRRRLVRHSARPNTAKQ
jgi:hypothetical protein